MPATFSRTLSSLDGDRSRRRGPTIFAAVLASSWAAWFLGARVAVYDVSEDARLEVQSAAHPVAAQVDGRVLETHLAIGREIGVGEVLVVLDAEEQRLALQECRAAREGLVARVEALRRQIAAERGAAANHREARVVALDELRAKAEESAARARFADLQLSRIIKLVDRGAAASEEYHRARAEAEVLRAGLRTDRLAIERLEGERAVQEGDRRARLAALEAQEVGLRGEIGAATAASLRLEHAVGLRHVRAPVSGRVGEVAAEFRVGSVVRAGERLGAIVPPGAPCAVALFPAAAVGRLRPGQPARLRLHGFPWTQYGTIPARVARVGDEARGGRIRVELDLRPDPRSPIPVAHGLPGTVEVEVERATPAALALRAAGRVLAARRALATSPGSGPEP